MRFASLMTATLLVSLASIALGQLPGPPAQAGQGVGQGLAPPPGGQQQGRGAQGGRGGARGADAGPALPTPRWPDGKPRLGAVPGGKGLWNGGGSTADANTPYQPWARAVVADRRANEMEPHTRCKPSGGPRQFLTPYGVEIVDMPELQRVYILDVGGPHTFRVIEIPRILPPAITATRSAAGKAIPWSSIQSVSTSACGLIAEPLLIRRSFTSSKSSHALT